MSKFSLDPLQRYAEQAIAVNEFLEDFIVDADLRLRYVFHILRGMEPPSAKATVSVERKHLGGDPIRAPYSSVNEAVDAPSGAVETIGPNAREFSEPWGTKRATGEKIMRHHGHIFHDWTAGVRIGRVIDTDLVIEIMGASFFQNRRQARIIVGNILRDDNRWVALLAKRRGTKQHKHTQKRRNDHALMWIRINPAAPRTDALLRAANAARMAA